MSNPQPPAFPAPTGQPVRPDVPVQRAPVPSSWDHPNAPARPVAPPPAPVEQVERPQQPWAPWWRRVCATLLDTVFLVPFAIAWYVGFDLLDQGSLFTLDNEWVGVDDGSTVLTGFIVLALARITMVAFNVWNTIVRQGNKGWSLGKEIMGIMVVGFDGKPIGKLLTIVRNVAHIVDTLALGLGWLWPLWDERRQTFADKIVGTCVLDISKMNLDRPAHRNVWE